MKVRLLIALLCLSAWVKAQTISDGLMMPRRNVCTGFIISQDQWTNYWEGTLKRDNQNIGSVTTQSLTWMANYGVTNRINVIVMLPYVWSKASAGTLTPMEGFQDVSASVKYMFVKKKFDNQTLKAFGVLTVSTPLTDYTPDFLPLSLGLSSTNVSWRGTAQYELPIGLYISGSAAYTWRSNVFLDRSSYYAEGRLIMSNEVRMPNTFDFIVNAGYHKGPLQLDANFMQFNTLGGDDIRRQDMPFVSNKMNMSRIGAFVMYYLPAPKGLAVRGGVNHTIAGRNVGQAFTVFSGLLYTFSFNASSAK